jgi:hypothetical protein
MGARPPKVNAVGLKLVDAQKVAADVALPVIGPVTFQGVIKPFQSY